MATQGTVLIRNLCVRSCC